MEESSAYKPCSLDTDMIENKKRNLATDVNENSSTKTLMYTEMNFYTLLLN